MKELNEYAIFGFFYFFCFFMTMTICILISTIQSISESKSKRKSVSMLCDYNDSCDDYVGEIVIDKYIWMDLFVC